MRNPAKVSSQENGSRGWVVPVSIGAVVCLLVLLFSVWVDRRMSRLESEVETQPPPRYQALDLAAYAETDLAPEALVVNQAIYVPVYSHVYFGGGRPYPLETTLSIRNTDPRLPLYIRSVRYFDTKGDLATTFVDELIRLDALETVDFLVPARNTIGGSGANFIVEWGAAHEALNVPLIEAVMVGAGGNQAISFTRTGRPIVTEPSHSPEG